VRGFDGVGRLDCIVSMDSLLVLFSYIEEADANPRDWIPDSLWLNEEVAVALDDPSECREIAGSCGCVESTQTDLDVAVSEESIMW
jgi:hypothetical protein